MKQTIGRVLAVLMLFLLPSAAHAQCMGCVFDNGPAECRYGPYATSGTNCKVLYGTACVFDTLCSGGASLDLDGRVLPKPMDPSATLKVLVASSELLTAAPMPARLTTLEDLWSVVETRDCRGERLATVGVAVAEDTTVFARLRQRLEAPAVIVI